MAIMQLAFDFNRPNDYTIDIPTHVGEFWTAKQRSRTFPSRSFIPCLLQTAATRIFYPEIL